MVVEWVLSFDVGRKNLACCLLRRRADWHVAFWHVFRVEDHHRGTRLHRELYRQFDAVFLDKELVDLADPHGVVLVERQPRSNPQMRVMEAIVEAYFALRASARCLDYSSRHKLSGQLEPQVNTYAARKRASVQAATRFVDTHADAVSAPARGVWDATRKKDDLADALLQALAYVRSDGGDQDASDDEPDAPFTEQEMRRWIPRREPKDVRNHVRKLYTRSQVKWFFAEWFGSGRQKTLPHITDAEEDGGLLRKQFQAMLNARDHARVARSVRYLWPDLTACVTQMCCRPPSARENAPMVVLTTTGEENAAVVVVS